MVKLIKIVSIFILLFFMIIFAFYLRGKICPTISDWGDGKGFFILANTLAYILFFIILLLFNWQINKWFPKSIKVPFDVSEKFPFGVSGLEDNPSDVPVSITTIGLLFFIIFFPDYPLLVISYFNQYASISPITNVETQITSKQGFRRQSFNTPKVYFKIFNKTQSIRDLEFYNILQVNDKVLIKMRKGRLGRYVVLELDVIKNNSLAQYDLVGRG